MANKFRFGSHEDIVEVRGWVADRIDELVTLRPDDISVYKYSVLCRIYQFAKTKFLGFSTKKAKQSSVGTEVRRVQQLVRYYTAVYVRNSSEKNLCRLRVLHKKLLEKW